ncbi:MAG: hypothetical protein IT223_12005 [Crocinitomicaceae bacterium]|nr:hypothetical protein [Crocinitomicaceae bacterium]
MTAQVVNAQNPWFVGIGATRTLRGQQIGDDPFFLSDYSADTVVGNSISGKGRFGFYAELGKDYPSKRPAFLSGWEWGIHFKSIRVRETFNAYILHNDAQVPFSYTGIFSRYYPGIFLNFYKELPLVNDVVLMRHNIGINADYCVMSGSNTGKFFAQKMPFPGQRLAGQLHYRLSFPLLFIGSHRITPSIETPVLNIVPWNNGRSTLEFFNFRFRPLIISVRYDLGKRGRKDRECTGIPEKRQKPELWAPEMRKFKRK